MAEETREGINGDREESWTRHIKLWGESGLTQIEYCRQNNLSKHRFTYWKCKRQRKDEPVKFVPLYPRHATRNQSLKDSGLRLIIGERYRIEIGEVFSEDVLYRLMAALERVM
jgi:hypothetical protein